MIYGYIRVSSKDQLVDRQLIAFKEFDIPQKSIYIDKQSGKDFKRPSYMRLMKKLKKGDLLIVKSIDRLGRNYDEIIDQWRIITKVKEADILIIDMPLLDTRRQDNGLTGRFVADLVLQILSYVAQTEREFIHQRQAEGIAAAKRRGIKFGREPVELPQNFNEVAKRKAFDEISFREAGKLCGLSKNTFYNHYKRLWGTGWITDGQKLDERPCPVCKKVFRPAPYHSWYIQIGNYRELTCTYSCMRVWEKENLK